MIFTTVTHKHFFLPTFLLICYPFSFCFSLLYSLYFYFFLPSSHHCPHHLTHLKTFFHHLFLSSYLLIMFNKLLLFLPFVEFSYHLFTPFPSLFPYDPIHPGPCKRGKVPDVVRPATDQKALLVDLHSHAGGPALLLHARPRQRGLPHHDCSAGGDGVRHRCPQTAPVWPHRQKPGEQEPPEAFTQEVWRASKIRGWERGSNWFSLCTNHVTVTDRWCVQWVLAFSRNISLFVGSTWFLWIDYKHTIFFFVKTQ